MRCYVGELLGSYDIVSEDEWDRYKNTTGKWDEYQADHGPFGSFEAAKDYVKDKYENDYMWHGGSVHDNYHFDLHELTKVID